VMADAIGGGSVCAPRRCHGDGRREGQYGHMCRRLSEWAGVWRGKKRGHGGRAGHGGGRVSPPSRARRGGPGAPRGPYAAPARKKCQGTAAVCGAAARRRRRGWREARLRRVRARRGGPGVPRSQVKDGLEEAELAAQTGPMRCRVGGAPEPLRSQTRILGACRFLLRSSVPSANTARACITNFFHPGQRFAPVRR
jgi:hypothetical protein